MDAKFRRVWGTSHPPFPTVAQDDNKKGLSCCEAVLIQWWWREGSLVCDWIAKVTYQPRSSRQASIQTGGPSDPQEPY